MGRNFKLIHYQPPKPKDNHPAESPKIIVAKELFQGRREIWIECGGERYRLRITRRNRLNLQK
jgi:hemin uptake protein HemP